MPTIRLAAASLNQTPLDWEGNLARVVAAIDAARDAGAGLLCLPELCLSGYGCEDAFFAPHVRERALRSLVELAPHIEGLAVCVGLPIELDGKLYNAAAMLANRRLLGMACKQHLANDGIHYEARWFTPWPAGMVESIEVAGEATRVGDLTFDFAGVGVGVEVCRDAWVADRPARRHAERGVSVLLNPSASHFAFGKQAIRERLVREGAAAVGGVCVYTNLLGNEAGRAIYDGGSLFAQATGGAGELIATGRRFSYRDHTLTCVDIEVDARAAEDAACVASEHALLAPTELARGCEPVEVEPTPTSLDEFTRAVPLGLFDYLRKSGARGFVLSLSGGADSAATAVAVALMAIQARRELGAEAFAERLPNTPGLADVSTDVDAVRRLLTTVYQATRNSSDITRDAARAVAGAIGATHHEWDVDDLVAGYTGLASDALGRELTWEADDIALQNIQSRVRSPGVWMLANLLGGLLLTTGNRSEASVGYATMDGDTSGGLAPLAGVDKAFLLEWLRVMETTGCAGEPPLPALAAVNAQQPTAELRPKEAGQTDETDLMPYPVLAAIERSAIGRLETPEATLGVLRAEFPEHDPEQLAAWVERFWRLWRASQWKRERLAPSFHLDTLNVDPRSWRRWPILSGKG